MRGTVTHAEIEMMKQTLLLWRPRGVQRPIGGKAKAWAFQPWKASAYWSFERRVRVAGWWALRLPAESLPCQQQCSGAEDSRQRAADLSLIDRRSGKTWNGAAFFPATESLMISLPHVGAESEWKKMRRKRAWFFCLNEWAEGGTYVSVTLKSSLFWWSRIGFFKRLFECLTQLYWKQLCFEAGTLPCLFMFNIAFKNSITAIFSQYSEQY